MFFKYYVPSPPLEGGREWCFRACLAQSFRIVKNSCENSRKHTRFAQKSIIFRIFLLAAIHFWKMISHRDTKCLQSRIIDCEIHYRDHVSRNTLFLLVRGRHLRIFEWFISFLFVMKHNCIICFGHY